MQQLLNYKYETLLHHLVAMIGGYFAGCTVFGNAGALGTSMTANLIQSIESFLATDTTTFWYRIIGCGLYLISCALFVLLRDKTTADVQLVSLLIDSLAFLICGWMPLHISVVIMLWPVFFASAFQYNAFPGK